MCRCQRQVLHFSAWTQPNSSAQQAHSQPWTLPQRPNGAHETDAKERDSEKGWEREKEEEGEGKGMEYKSSICSFCFPKWTHDYSEMLCLSSHFFKASSIITLKKQLLWGTITPKQSNVPLMNQWVVVSQWQILPVTMQCRDGLSCDSYVLSDWGKHPNN